MSNISAREPGRFEVTRRSSPAERLIGITGGTFRLGSDFHYPEEAPAHYCTVTGFRVADTPVTVAQFSRFCADSGYCTAAEKQGSMLFSLPLSSVLLNDPAEWWRWDMTANWRAPRGVGSTAQPDHPVVHVTLNDARAYADWYGLRLPNAAEWEVAARGGLDSADYSWGHEYRQGLANIWSGQFPMVVAGTQPGPSPVRSFPANGYGLFDLIGNVWEWTVTPWRGADGCRAAKDADKAQFVLKGGSFLCAANYCARYRPSAKIGYPAERSAEHIGFRCFAAATED
jgi:formylglycine-generating enzyme